MMRTSTKTIVAVGSVISLLMWATVALADDTVCQNRILGQETVVNLIVPDGSTCTLNDTIVQGNIHVGTGATLRAKGVEVDGNIQAEGARSVNVVVLNGERSFVGGNIQIKQGGTALIDHVDVTEDLQFEENRGKVSATKNVIGGNLQAHKNAGGVTIRNNRIAENLQCFDNNPPPTGGGIPQGTKMVNVRTCEDTPAMIDARSTRATHGG
jgi:hypothetical protein